MAIDSIQLESINEILQGIYVNQLFIIGTVGAVFVCYILYKFLKQSF